MYDVVTIGAATEDVFLTSKLFKIIKDPKHLKKIGIPTGEAECFTLGAKIEIDNPVFTTGGGAANTAVAFTRQGLKTALLVKLGRDAAGQRVLKKLKKEKVSVFPVFDKNLSTAYSAILLSLNGRRTILVHHGASGNLKTAEIPFKKIKSRWAYIAPGNIPFSTLLKIYSRLEKQKTLIAINPSKHLIEMGIKKLKPVLSKSKVVILNREEASYLTKIDYSKEKLIFKKLDAAIDGIAVMTNGAQGAMVSDGKKIYSAGTSKKRDVVDETGAGDAFSSGFISGLIRTKEKCDKNKCDPKNIAYAIRLGSANAASAIEKIGATEGLLTRRGFENNKKWRSLKIMIQIL